MDDRQSRKENQKLISIVLMIMMLGLVSLLVINNMDFYVSRPGLLGLFVKRPTYTTAYVSFFAIFSIGIAAVMNHARRNRQK